ncbi:hypothetical protein [Mycobacterium asiaticum]|uniref:Uncharacterized protein n=1 Tax=Mycobacterium asiaticum TaxID=1790 RepID=A0A1A3NL23_MYCAS|nr:hypothetical protein [Mycobacterium asiaticum]OBK22526.1 hypothetical protein A5635_21660 [Mycobacterium asiaticum]
MTDTLNYRGDCRNFDPDHIYGPDLFRGCYRAFTAEFDAATDRTSLHLVPIPLAELQERAITKSLELQAERDIRERIEQLFGTGAA